MERRGLVHIVRGGLAEVPQDENCFKCRTTNVPVGHGTERDLPCMTVLRSISKEMSMALYK